MRVLLNDIEFKENFISWQDRKDVISRSATFHGIMMSQSLDLQFIKEAYDFIINLDNLYDVAAECTIKIQNFDSQNGYTDDFTGLLDFYTLKQDTKDTKKLTISAYSDDFSNKLLERTEIEIPYDRLESLDEDTITPFTNEYEEVDILGIESVSKAIGAGDSSERKVEPAGGLEITIPLIFESNNSNVLNPIYRQYVSDPIKKIGDLFYITRTLSTVDLDFEFDWILDQHFPLQLEIATVLEYVTEDGLYRYNVQNVLYSQSFTGSSYHTASIDLSNISLVANEGLCMYFTMLTAGIFRFIPSQFSTLNITMSEIATPTPCNFVPPFEAGQRIIESLTGQTTGLDSPILGRTDTPTVYDEDGIGSLLFLTNGKLIRQFPTGYTTDDSEKKSQLTFSLKEWFESLDRVLCLGAGVKYEDDQYKLYVDDRKEFFKNTVLLEISRDVMEVDTFEKEKDTDLYYNEIEVGSTYEAPSEISGLEEYNSKQNYSTPLLNENKLDLLCKWIYAVYPFEFARRKKFEGTETEDYKYDNNNFIFQVYRDGADFIQQTDEDFDEVNGLENIETYMNLPITPSRILKRFGWWLNAGFRGVQTKLLRYNSSDIVTDLSTRKTSESTAIKENEDRLISNLESAKFTGKIVRFSAPVSSSTFKLIQGRPYELIKYYDVLTGVDGYGFIKEVSTSLIDKSTNWELIESDGFSESGNFRLLQDGSYRLLEDGISKRLLES